jgi:hypothetical protein
MKKTIKLLTIITTSFLILSFTGINANEYTGTYGVGSTDPSQIKLIIHSDHTFYYQDYSDPNEKIVVNGNWIVKGKKMVLHGNNTAKKFHNIWTFEKDGQVAKSRKGFTFYRLTKTGN